MKKLKLFPFSDYLIYDKITKILVWIFFIFSIFWVGKVILLNIYPDFSGYYYGSKLMLTGENPYLGGSDLYTTYVYPPVVLLIFAPILMLNYEVASHFWVLLNLVLLISSFYVLSKFVEVNFFSKSNLFLMGLFLSSFPVKFSLGMGQINILILFFLVLTLWFLKANREYLAGIFLGLSISIKLFPLFLPIYLLIKLRKKKGITILPWIRLKIWFSKKQFIDDLHIVDGILTVIVFSLLAVIIFIPEKTYNEFFFNTLPSFFSSWKTDYYNQALSGFVGRGIGVNYYANIIKTIISTIITLITLYIVTKNENESFFGEGLKFGTLITLSVIVNNFSWQHHFIWLVIPFYITFYYMLKNKFDYKYFLIFFFSFILIGANLKEPLTFPLIFQSHVFFGALLFLYLSCFILHKNK